MRIPKKASRIIKKILGRYTLDEEAREFNIIHLYDTKKFGVTNYGYHDSRFFDVHAFNTKTKVFRIFKWHDAIIFDGNGVHEVRIFADGSTLISFPEPVHIDDGQCIRIKKAERSYINGKESPQTKDVWSEPFKLIDRTR